MAKPHVSDAALFAVAVEGPEYSADRAAYQAHLLEQYKLYVEKADKISERRQSANSYFLSINSALLAFVGYATAKESSDYLWLLGIAGMALSYLWYGLGRSYRALNTAKFAVIHAIERRLPLSPYHAEWEAVGKGDNPSLYKPFSHIELGVPWVFFGLHGFVLLRAVPWRTLREWIC